MKSRKVKVVVTQKHIDNGVQEDAYSCPIALALVDYGFDEVEVDGGEEVKFREYGAAHQCRLPPSAQEFIGRFDRNQTWVKPFEFELELDAPWVRYED